MMIDSIYKIFIIVCIIFGIFLGYKIFLSPKTMDYDYYIKQNSDSSDDGREINFTTSNKFLPVRDKVKHICGKFIECSFDYSGFKEVLDENEKRFNFGD